MEEKRLFIGAEVWAPWPKEEPRGRHILPENRHLTLEFLGNVKPPELRPPRLTTALVGKTDKLVFLPKKEERIAAYHIEFYGEDLLKSYIGKEYLPHVSVARAPFNKKEWEENFTPLPVIIPAIHLYMSIGNLTYKPLATHKLPLPFVEIEHAADIAFHIYGNTLAEIFLHAQIALAFKFPPLLKYVNEGKPTSLDEIIMALNVIVALTDQDMGCPFKAVSFHGEYKNNSWEMIVDV